MNYRHAFHAGNFADVVKHSAIALLVERLKAKEAAFRVIDTHAGTGLYDLKGSEAGRTGEWREGIGRLHGRSFDPKNGALFAPFLRSVAAANPDGELHFYPGSPLVVHTLLRPQDRMTVTELHPDDSRALKTLFAGDRQVKVIALDGWLALGSFVPPRERRGLVLVDPPFEEPNEFETMLAGFRDAWRRWPGGIYALWYPVKDLAAIDRFRAGLRESGIKRILRAELMVRSRSSASTFNGTGLIICNSPWQFEESLAALLHALQPVLAKEPGAGIIIDPISGE